MIGALAARSVGAAAFAALAISSPAAASTVPQPFVPCPPPVSTAPAQQPPLASPAPEQIVVCVGATPITGKTYLHWVKIAARSSSSGARGHKHSPSAVAQALARRSEVLDFLISGTWVQDEAAALGIHVSEAAVRRRFVHIREEQFKKPGSFRRFMRATGQTVADLLYRVEQQIDSEAIQRRETAGKKGAAAQKALAEFVRAFKGRWQPQTVCESGFEV
ncbi:MAG TPA: SurA N-terminal domain-containing protein, partial [Solirubrobacteraceae bacterium]|nr:SurA N-terminal domain-containing protein [Solirubrobacteraceae bacterium]